MHSALVIVEKKPGYSRMPEQITWKQLLNELNNAISGNAAVETLSEGVFLFDLSKGAEVFAAALHAASGDRYRVLFFEEPPAWVRSTPEPSQ